jgi:hypothetical protein
MNVEGCAKAAWIERLDSFRPAASKLVEQRSLLRRTDTKSSPDLTERTGLNVHQVDVVRIDMLRDCAHLIISHRSNERPG